MRLSVVSTRHVMKPATSQRLRRAKHPRAGHNGALNMPRRKKDGSKPPAWKSSKAKEILRQDIVDGVVKPTDRPIAVWQSREIYQVYSKDNFATNLRNLRKAIANDRERASVDAAIISKDMCYHPRAVASAKGYPRWDGSDAQGFLKLDMNEGKHKSMTPKALRETRPEYMAFPLKVFSDHIQQELRERIERPYWKAYHASKKSKR